MVLVWKPILILLVVSLFCISCSQIPSTNNNPWQRISLPTEATFADVAFTDDANHGWLVGTQATLFETTDGGDTWTPVGNAPSAADGEWSTPLAVTWVNDSIGWFGSNMSKAYNTTDRGTSWSSIAIPSYSSYMRLAFNKTGIGLASSGDAFQRTRDAWRNTTNVK